MALVPREDCAKVVLHGPKPREAVRSQDEKRDPGSMLGVLSAAWPQLRPRWSPSGLSAQGWAGVWTLIYRERVEKEKEWCK